MAIYSVNQNRQFYVITGVVPDTPTEKGQLQIGKTKDGKQIFFKHFGKGGLTRTDLIDVDKACYAKLIPRVDMQRKLKKATVTLSADVNGGKPIVGQDYVLRIQVNNFLSPGDASVYIKSNAVHATKAMSEDVGKFYQAMVDSLKKNFSREKQTAGMNLLKFEVSKTSDDGHTANGIIITEVADQPWRLGVLSQEPVNFEVIPTTVRFGGEDVIWGTVEMGEAEGYVGNGKQIADLEYFCSAERGDMFRKMGYPLNIDVKMMVDPELEYDVLDLHYFFSDAGVQVHKSEKDITFVSNTAKALTDLKTALTTAGITVE